MLSKSNIFSNLAIIIKQHLMATKKTVPISEYKYSGFGSKTDHQPERLLNQDGSLNVRKTGLSFFDHFSVFHFLVTTNWITFNSLVIITYLLINIIFGLLSFAHTLFNINTSERDINKILFIFIIY